MKKILLILLALTMCVSVCSCGKITQAKSSVAQVIDNEGETIELTAKELIEIYQENPARFDKLYKNAEITIEGKITSIDSSSEPSMGTVLYKDAYEITLDYVWEVKILATTCPELADVENGDTITVISKIKSVDDTHVYMKSMHTEYPLTKTDDTVIKID